MQRRRGAVAAARWAGTTAALAAAGAAAAATASVKTADSQSWEYRVERGDTLIGIANGLLIEPRRWVALQRLNHVADPRRLRPGSVLRFPAAWVRRTGTPATLVFVHGDVRVGRAGATADAAPATAAAGMAIEPGDMVETATDATATLRFADGSRLLVPAGTRLRLDALEALGRAQRPHTVVNLQQGEADAQVTPAAGPGPRVFTITTPAVNLGVRGTEFRARFDRDAGEAQAEVTDGTVVAEVAGAKPAPLPAGFGIALSGTAAAATSVTPVRLLPAPDLAAVPTRLERVPLRFDWPAVEGAATYRAEVLGDGDDLLLDSQPATAATRWPDLPDGTYRLRVRGVDGRGLEGRDADHPFVLKARPEAPLMLEPRTDARSYGPETTFQWAMATVPRHYRLQVSSRQDFAAPEIDRAGLAGSTATVPLAPGPWWWRMAAVNDPDDAGPFGDPQAFEQRATPEPPALQAPRQDARGLAFAWGSLPPGRHVHFQVATDTSFEHVVAEDTTDQAEGLLPKPAPGKYYIRARTVDDDGFEGPWGAPQFVEVHASWWWLLIPLGVVLWSL